jgi:hypothetical protein
MGFRPDGVHVFGVVSPHRTRDGQEQIMVVEAMSWAQFADDEGGQHLALSDSKGEIVERFGPGEWSDVLMEVPGVDAPEEEPS